jgi:hypothetical protein
MSRSAAFLADASAALDFAVLQQWSRAVIPGDDEVRCYPDAAEWERTPRVLVLGVLRSVFGYFEAVPTDAELAQVFDRLIADKRVNTAGVQATPGSVAGERVWLFAPENPRRTG